MSFVCNLKTVVQTTGICAGGLFATAQVVKLQRYYYERQFQPIELTHPELSLMVFRLRRSTVRAGCEGG